MTGPVRPISRLKTSLAGPVRRFAYKVAKHLKPPRDDAFRALLRSARDLVEGREPAMPIVLPDRLEVTRPSSPVEPLPEAMGWSTPPPTQATLVTRSIYDTGARPPRFNVDLLESLNAEYANKRLVATPPSYKSDAKYQVALGRVKWTHGHVDLRGKTVLEIGCGDGYGTWILGTDLGCDSFGVDVQQRASWAALEGDTVHFACADISQDQIYEPGTFDRIVSYTVWEHVVHPFAMLQETYRLLKPGGLAWIRANLYAGPRASHRYRDIYFPWPHLLFPDDVIREWDTKHGRPAKGSSWVNRLSWLHYERCIADLGFGVRHLHFQNAKWDEEFYQRFEDILGRFPRTDLERDFFLVVLEKPS